MSLVNSDVDLSALARPETSSGRTGVEPPKRGWLRIVLPLAILGVFGAILWSTARDFFADRPIVSVVRPERVEGDADSARAAIPRVAVQAAGWVEPDPFPIYAAALAGGVVSEVLVQESDSVAAGEPLARLVVDDARLARDRAAADVTRQEASFAAAEARATIAAERFEAALAVTEARDRARARVAGKEAEARHRAAAVRGGEADVALAESEIVVQKELDEAGASGARQVEIAEAALESARAKLEVLRSDAALASSDLEEERAALARAERDVELRFEDRLERDVSAADAKRAAGELAAARAALAEAELRLERMSVVAPQGAVVLERLVAPGQELGAGAPVASLYDPHSLRVRVDVQQSDVEKLTTGMAAEVLSEARPGRPYAGEVIRIVQRADIQKVTLEAQVRVLATDGLLRPDMLCQVKFLGGTGPAGGDGDQASASGDASSGSRGELLRIPEGLVDEGDVWVFDPVEGAASQRSVEVVGTRDGYAIVAAGLNLTDKLIDPSGTDLEPGMRVEVRKRHTQ